LLVDFGGNLTVLFGGARMIFRGRERWCRGGFLRSGVGGGLGSLVGGWDIIDASTVVKQPGIGLLDHIALITWGNLYLACLSNLNIGLFGRCWELRDFILSESGVFVS
jgi:hypothetical protein